MRWGILLCLLLSCGAQRTYMPTAAPITNASPAFRAGVSVVDITTPLGISLMGHGPESRIALGQQQRLRCTAFVFSKAQLRVAVVTCDLAYISKHLQESVVDRLPPRLGLSVDRVFLSAIHTHAGPAHFMDTQQLNGSFSHRVPGFAPDMVGYLSTKIADAIQDACAHEVPATVSWNAMEVRGIAINRSLRAFLRNPDRADVLAADTSASMQSRAIDPQLRVASLRNMQGGVFGVLATFSVHPTALPNTNDRYGADLFGVAVRRATDQLRVPVGLFNGAEGDVAPDVETHGLASMIRLGEQLGAAIAQVAQVPSPVAPDSAFQVVYNEYALPSATVSTGVLCARPQVGAPAAGGADDGRTRFRVAPPMNPGMVSEAPSGCFGPMVPMSMIGPLAPGRDLPRIAPLGLLRLGNGLLAFVPAELSTVTGRRIRRSLATVLGGQVSDAYVSVVGLTNSYLQYVATREEYLEQLYEGASTIYGPFSAEFYRERLKLMALGRVPILLRFERTAPQYSLEITALPTVHSAPNVTDITQGSESIADDLPAMEWEFTGGLSPTERDLPLNTSRVAVRSCDGSREFANELGYRLVLRWINNNVTNPRWRVQWIPAQTTSEGVKLCVTHGGNATCGRCTDVRITL